MIKSWTFTCAVKPRVTSAWNVPPWQISKHTCFNLILVSVTIINYSSCAGPLTVVPHTVVPEFLSQVAVADGTPRSRARKDAIT